MELHLASWKEMALMNVMRVLGKRPSHMRAMLSAPRVAGVQDGVLQEAVPAPAAAGFVADFRGANT